MRKEHRFSRTALALLSLCVLLAICASVGLFSVFANELDNVLPEIPFEGERSFTATFVADGVVVDTVTFYEGQRPAAPALPEKFGYTGRWEDYEPQLRDFTVNASYIAKTCVYTDPETGATKAWKYGATPTVTPPVGYEASFTYAEAADGTMTVSVTYTALPARARILVENRTYYLTYDLEDRDAAIAAEIEALKAGGSIPAKRGYEVSYEVKDLANDPDAMAEVTVTYKPITYTIEFLGPTGETLASHTYTVEDTTFPKVTVPAKEGYIAGWSVSEIPSSLGDLTVTPVYTSLAAPVEEKTDITAYIPWILIGAAVLLLLIALVMAIVTLVRKKAEKKPAPAKKPATEKKPAPVKEAPAPEKPKKEESKKEEPKEEPPKAEDPPAPVEEAAPAPARKHVVVPEGEKYTAGASALSSIRTGDDGDDMTTMLVLPDGRHVLIKYRKSFRARMIQSDDETKSYYSEVKNYLLSFDGVAASDSWNYESFAYGRRQLAKINVSGKTIVLFLALDPASLEGSKYKYDDVGDRKRFEKTPVKVKVRSPRSFKWAKELIDMTMEAAERPFVALLNENFIDPYEEKEPLIARELIQITATEVESGAKVNEEEIVDLIANGARIEGTSLVEAIPVLADVTPEIASTMVDNTVATSHILHVSAKTEEEKSAGKSAEGKQDIINIDVLNACYEANETVDIESMKAKGLIPKSVARVKVLARGHLSKPLTVIADDFSLDAVKMILLTGGTPIELD